MSCPGANEGKFLCSVLVDLIRCCFYLIPSPGPGKRMRFPRSKSKDCNCLLANIRSWSKNVEAVVYAILRYGLHLIILTETWLKPELDSEVFLGNLRDSYSVIRCDRQDSMGGGVAIVVKQELHAHPIFSESIDCSYQVIACNLYFNEMIVRIIAVYRSPKCMAKENKQLIKCVSDLTSCSYPCLLLGDFNYPNIQWSGHGNRLPSGFVAFRGMTVSHGYKQMVNFNTRGNHALDLVFCNSLGMVHNVRLSAPLGSSDHGSVLFNLNCQTAKPKPILVSGQLRRHRSISR